jgi:hypothetical protein
MPMAVNGRDGDGAYEVTRKGITGHENAKVRLNEIRGGEGKP